MTKQFADNGQADATANPNRGVGMPQIMNSRVAEPRLAPHGCPKPRQPAIGFDRRAAGSPRTRKQITLFRPVLRQLGEELSGWRGQDDRLPPALAVGQPD